MKLDCSVSQNVTIKGRDEARGSSCGVWSVSSTAVLCLQRVSGSRCQWAVPADPGVESVHLQASFLRLWGSHLL